MTPTKADRETVRLDAWRAVFEKTNRIISERRVTVSITSDIPYGMGPEVPAWTDGEDIFFNQDKVLEMLKGNDAVAAVLRLKGLNYHELSHVLYTPRMSDEIARRVSEEVKRTGDMLWWQAFNALEDQRIETWFTTTYGPSRRYFEAAVLEWLVKHGNAEAAILTYGRKYLPASLRAQAGVVFVQKYSQSLYDEFKGVIDAYLTVVPTVESTRAWMLVKRFHDLIGKMRAANPLAGLPAPIVPDNGCHSGAGQPGRGQPGAVRAGRVMTRDAKQVRDDVADALGEQAEADKAAEADAAAKAAAKGQGSGSQEQSDQSGADGGESGQSDGEDAADGQDGNGATGAGSQSAGAADAGTSTSDTQSAGQGGQGAGGGHVDRSQDAEADLVEAVNDLVAAAHDALDEVEADENVIRDAEQVLDAVRAIAQNGQIDAKGVKARPNGSLPVAETTSLAVRRIVQTLLRIRQEAEPGVVRRQTSGRVDPRRVLERRPNEIDLFRQWDEGAEDETDIEAVFLMDVSGSMSWVMNQANEALWVLKRSFDRLGMRATVLIFDDGHQVVYQPGERAPAGAIPVVFSGGGTDPETALQQAALILNKSHAPNKVLVTLTDGQWQQSDDVYVRLLKGLHAMEVSTLLLGMGGAVSSYGKHGHKIGHDITTITEMPKVVTRLAAEIMRNATRRA